MYVRACLCISNLLNCLPHCRNENWTWTEMEIVIKFQTKTKSKLAKYATRVYPVQSCTISIIFNGENGCWVKRDQNSR